MTRERLALGAAGEDLAARWYLRRGYRLVARNWRCREGELDLVLLAPDGTLVFSEVKTRRSARFGVPAEAVTVEKQRRLRVVAARFLSAYGKGTDGGRGAGGRPRRGLRFDVVSVLAGKVEVIEGAF